MASKEIFTFRGLLGGNEKKWLTLRERLVQLGREHPSARQLVYDLLQEPGKPPINPWPEEKGVPK